MTSSREDSIWAA